ncbi:MAG: phosphate ABC transporter permease subunit PstC [Spirochaetales bacterium]|nr:phosphate ABC transporter permease subunit PstC [Spirochaetales bacterium]
MPGRAALRRASFASPRSLLDSGERALLGTLACALVLLPFVIGGGLLMAARGLLATKTVAELFAPDSWNPMRGRITYLPFLIGTLWVTGLAVLIALPLSLAVAVYASEYAPRRFGAVLKPAVDVVAGLPSVIFGLWGVALIVPVTGYNILAAAFVLAVMIMPIIIQIAMEVFSAVPPSLREAAFALGATRFEVVNRVVLKKSRPGLVAASVLALARAFGETLAVMMVIGGAQKGRLPQGPLDQADTLPTLIANRYGEMSSVPLVSESLLGAAFILFLVVVGFTLVSRVVLARVKRGME